MNIQTFKHVTIVLQLCIFASCNGQVSFPQGGGSGGQQLQQTSRPQVPSGPSAKLSGCNCLPADKCPQGYGQLGIGCILETEGAGICCVPQQGVVLNRVGFTNSGFSPKTLSDEVIQKGYDNGQADIQRFQELDRGRLSSGKYLKKGSPSRGHAYFFHRDPDAVKEHNLAYLIAMSSLEIAKSESLTPQQSFFGLPEVRIGNNLRNFQCPAKEIPRCNPGSAYRTVTGVCNNINNPNWGKSNTIMGRLSPPLYNDGIMSPRSLGVNGRPLPGPRESTNNILIDIDAPDTQLTLAVMQWSQFMDHDLTQAPFPDMDGEAIMCCENGKVVDPLPQHCFPIMLPPNDAFYAPKGQTCINFVRSMIALKENCALGPVEQLNMLTHYLDGSMIYGSTQEEHGRVADRGTGFMKISNHNLPPLNSTIDCEARIPNTPCFAGGDSRINEQPALTTMHTIWVREHNRIASILQASHPEWDPNTLFEETRRIVIGEVQNIAFKEWLPIIIGPSTMQRFGLVLPSSGYTSNYNPNVNPRINNEFAAACFRYGHTLLQGIFRLLSSTGRQSTIRLRDVFNNPAIMQNNPELIDAYVRALTTQNIQSFDNFITQDVTNHLFQTPQHNFGMDLMSLNVQRGRDHAIATYNQMRPIAGFPVAKSFGDLLDTTPAPIVRRIQTVYNNVDDIDLWVGVITERSLPDALVGPTMAAVIGTQFQALMKGDRFFYTEGGQTGSFPPDQLQEIRKSSMAKIFCDNTNVGQMQPDAFHAASNENPRLSCDQVHGMDLSVF